MSEAEEKEIEREELLRELLKDGASISHRFVAEPIFSKTGEGYLQPEGVEEIAKVKEDVEKN